MKLRCPEKPGEEIGLTGEWRAEKSLDIGDFGVSPVPLLGNANACHALFDSMLSTIIGFSAKGAIWYQGESNAGNYYQYEQLMTDLIRDWQAHWRQPEFAFIQVLLAGWAGDPNSNGTDMHWAELRQAQVNSARKTGTLFASAVDLGDEFDIHPLRKREVGERLAAVALSDLYGKPIAGHGPEARKAVRTADGKIRVEFAYADGLRAEGGESAEIEVSGGDGQFVPVRSEVKNDFLVAESTVPKPTSIRYAWRDYPCKMNLYNASGLPTIPFKLTVE
jgi:sialate O-acetylesterase